MMKYTLKHLQLLTAAGLLLICTSCGSNENKSTETTDSSSNTSVNEVANQAVTATKEAMASNPDSSFVTEVAAANAGELVLLQGAINKSGNAELKSHAKMMIKDHKNMADEVQAFAQKKNYMLPGDDGSAQKTLEDWNSKTGKDWDKEWADKMVSDHEKTIGKFEGAKNQVNDAELKAMIEKTLPTLRSHLDMATKLRDKLK